MEESLEKVPLEEEKITETVETFYEGEEIESPGVESKDIAQTILNPIKHSRWTVQVEVGNGPAGKDPPEPIPHTGNKHILFRVSD